MKHGGPLGRIEWRPASAIGVFSCADTLSCASINNDNCISGAISSSSITYAIPAPLAAPLATSSAKLLCCYGLAVQILMCTYKHFSILHAVMRCPITELGTSLAGFIVLHHCTVSSGAESITSYAVRLACVNTNRALDGNWMYTKSLNVPLLMMRLSGKQMWQPPVPDNMVASPFLHCLTCTIVYYSLPIVVSCIHTALAYPDLSAT